MGESRLKCWISLTDGCICHEADPAASPARHCCRRYRFQHRRSFVYVLFMLSMPCGKQYEHSTSPTQRRAHRTLLYRVGHSSGVRPKARSTRFMQIQASSVAPRLVRRSRQPQASCVVIWHCFLLCSLGRQALPQPLTMPPRTAPLRRCHCRSSHLLLAHAYRFDA